MDRIAGHYFRPLFRVGGRTAGAYRCVPVVLASDGGTRVDMAVLSPRADMHVVAARNAALMEDAFIGLADAHRQGNQVRIIVPVNSTSLASREAAAIIVGACKKLDPALRRYVIIEVFHLPSHLGIGSLDEITIPFMPFFNAFMAVPTPDMDDFTVFGNGNYFAVGIDLADRDLPPEEAQKRLMPFWAAAKKSRLEVFVHGIAGEAVKHLAERYEAAGMDGVFFGDDETAMPPRAIAAAAPNG